MANPVLVQALAELAYSIALADGELHPEEKAAFYEIIENELQNDAQWAINRFQLLEEKAIPDLEQSYDFALFTIKSNRSDFDNMMKKKFINVISKVADASDGLSSEEIKLIERFKRDVDNF